jgi:hypothetical protein
MRHSRRAAPTTPHGFCGIHRAEGCPEEHGSPLRPCMSCPMDWPDTEFRKPHRRNTCRLCYAAYKAEYQNRRYQTDPEYRARRTRQAQDFRAKRPRAPHWNPVLEYPRRKQRRQAAWNPYVLIGWVDTKRKDRSRGRAHAVVRDPLGRIAVPCGSVAADSAPLGARSKYGPCGRCAWALPHLAGVALIVEEPWRPSLPIVELEATA